MTGYLVGLAFIDKGSIVEATCLQSLNKPTIPGSGAPINAANRLGFATINSVYRLTTVDTVDGLGFTSVDPVIGSGSRLFMRLIPASCGLARFYS